MGEVYSGGQEKFSSTYLKLKFFFAFIEVYERAFGVSDDMIKLVATKMR